MDVGRSPRFVEADSTRTLSVLVCSGHAQPDKSIVSHTEMADPSPSLTFSSQMSSYNCFRDDCGEKFDSQRSWSQHVTKTHGTHPGTSLLMQVVSDHQDRKRKLAEQDEVQRVAKRRRQELDALEEIPPAEPPVRSPSLDPMGKSTE